MTTQPISSAIFSDRHFEGSERAAALIKKLNHFLYGELAELVKKHQITHEKAASEQVLRYVWKRSRECGFYGVTLPVEMGGLGLSITDHVLVKEAIYASGSPLAPHVFGELSGPPRVGALVQYASAWQMEHFINPVINAERAICFALTEPLAGSDAGAVQTTAIRDGDFFVINGQKRFISGAPFADFAVLIASTATESGKREISAFFVNLRDKGVRVERNYKTMAGQSTTGDIFFDHYRIPSTCLIGKQGRGLALALGRISVNRLLHCPAMLGLARVAFEDSVQYAQSRKQFDRPIAAFQVIQHSLADMATQLMAARALMISTAQQLDAGNETRIESSMAKLFCSESAFQIADKAVQIHGGEGIVQGRRVEFLFRMLRMYRVLTGTSEIQKNTIAKELLAV